LKDVKLKPFPQEGKVECAYTQIYTHSLKNKKEENPSKPQGSDAFTHEFF
jgi:hypothetical protein